MRIFCSFQKTALITGILLTALLSPLLIFASNQTGISNDLKIDFEAMKHFSSRCASEFASAGTKKPMREKGKVVSASRIKSPTRSEYDPIDIEGDWIFTFGDYYYGNNSVGSYNVIFRAVKSGNMIFFQDPTGKEFLFIGLYDALTGELTFPRTALGTAQTSSGTPVFLYQEPYIFNTATNDFDYQQVKAQFNSTAGTITFPERSGIDWIYYLDLDGTQFFTYGFTADLEKAVKDIPYVDNPEDWTSVGNALFMDAWVLPAFGIDQTDPRNMYEVALQQNKTNENLYRLVNPYWSGPGARYNQCADNGYIMFDVTDPDHVLVNAQKVEAGFANVDLEVTKLYCYNALVEYSLYLEKTPEEVIEMFGDEMPYTTFKDGIVSLSFYKDPKQGVIYDANFGDQTDRDGGFAWFDDKGKAANMEAKIFFPGAYDGISEISEDMNGAPVYYDINGIRVEKPAKGLYIIKSGTKVSKVFLK